MLLHTVFCPPSLLFGSSLTCSLHNHNTWSNHQVTGLQVPIVLTLILEFGVYFLRINSEFWDLFFLSWHFFQWPSSVPHYRKQAVGKKFHLLQDINFVKTIRPFLRFAYFELLKTPPREIADQIGENLSSLLGLYGSKVIKSSVLSYWLWSTL